MLNFTLFNKQEVNQDSSTLVVKQNRLIKFRNKLNFECRFFINPFLLLEQIGTNLASTCCFYLAYMFLLVMLVVYAKQHLKSIMNKKMWNFIKIRHYRS